MIARSRRGRSALLDDQEAVSVGIADEDLRRNRIVDGYGSRDEPRPAHAGRPDLRVDIDPLSAQARVGGPDVRRRERTASRVTAGGSTLARRNQRDRVAAPGGATSIRQGCPPKAKSARFSNPSLPTKNSNERSWSETGTNTVPTSLIPVAVAVVGHVHLSGGGGVCVSTTCRRCKVTSGGRAG